MCNNDYRRTKLVKQSVLAEQLVNQYGLSSRVYSAQNIVKEDDISSCVYSACQSLYLVIA